MKTNILLIPLLLFLGGIDMQGQTKIQVLTKTIEDVISFYELRKLVVNSQSADIQIETWDKREIKYQITFVSKGLSKKIAEKELKYQKYIIDKVDDKQIIKTYLLVPRELKELNSIQETRISLMVPKSLEISVQSSFGQIRINNLSGTVDIESEYGPISLNNLRGNLDIQSNFGELEVNQFSGHLKSNLKHTSTQLTQFSGSADIRTNLGDVNIYRLSNSSDIKVKAEKADISMSDLSTDDYSWDLKSKYGSIQFSDLKESSAHFELNQRKTTLPKIDLQTDFGQIIIKP